MAEELTINGEDIAEGLTADEQESLQIGEQMEQEQESLLAGKYNSPEQLEEAYLELQKKLGSREQEEEVEEDVEQVSEEYDEDSEQVAGLTDDDVEALQEMAGGEQAYGEMLEWAQNNFSEEEIDLFDAVIDGGDPAACFFAVQALMGRFSDSQGYDGELLTGGESAPTSTNAFRSQAELVAAMGDPRYDTDPAYRDDVLMKLENSDIEF